MNKGKVKKKGRSDSHRSRGRNTRTEKPKGKAVKNPVVVNNEECLICSGDTNKSWWKNFQLLPGSEGSELLNEQLWSVFILRQLLKYPEQKCTTLMKETYGISSPGKWFTLCSSCAKTAKSAMTIYLKIIKMERDLKCLQLQLQNTIKDSVKSQDSVRKWKGESKVSSENVFNIRAKIRSHFCEEADKYPVIIPKQEHGDHDECMDSEWSTFEDPLEFCQDDDRNDDFHSDCAENTGAKLDKKRNRIHTNLFCEENISNEEKKGTERQAVEAETNSISTSHIHISKSEVPEENPGSAFENDHDDGRESEYFGGESDLSVKKKKTFKRTQNKIATKSKFRPHPSTHKGQYECKICGHKGQGKYSFANHMRTHKYHKAFECPQCHFPCKTVIALERHLRASHNKKWKEEYEPFRKERRQEMITKLKESVIICEICKRTFSSIGYYNRHILNKHNHSKESTSSEKTVFECGICGAKPSTKTSFDCHMYKHRYNKECACPECHFPCTTPFGLEIHLQKNHRERWEEEYKDTQAERKKQIIDKFKQLGHNCKICRRRFISLDRFEKHMLDHEKYKEFTCSKCRYPLPSQDALESHKKSRKRCSEVFSATSKTSTSEGKTTTVYKCDSCTFSTEISADIEAHLEKHKIYAGCGSKNEVGQWVCGLCNETFASTHLLKAHKREVHGSEFGLKGYLCSQCPKILSSNQRLEMHVKNCHQSQNEESNILVCEECGYRTNRKNSMKRHVKIHSSVLKPFVCEICGNRYSLQVTLKYHMRTIHSEASQEGEKKFKCRYCLADDVAFTSQGLLYAHLKNDHGDLYTHKCEECGNTYMTKRSLNMHNRLSHGNNPVECEFCQSTFASRILIYKHYSKKGPYHCKKQPPGFKYHFPRPTKYTKNPPSVAEDLSMKREEDPSYYV